MKPNGKARRTLEQFCLRYSHLLFALRNGSYQSYEPREAMNRERMKKPKIRAGSVESARDLPLTFANLPKNTIFAE